MSAIRFGPPASLAEARSDCGGEPCPIGLDDLKEPIYRLDNHGKHTYYNAPNLARWVKDRGTDPITRAHIALDERNAIIKHAGGEHSPVEDETTHPAHGLTGLIDSAFSRHRVSVFTDMMVNDGEAAAIEFLSHVGYDPSRDNDAIITASRMGYAGVVTQLLGMREVDPSIQNNRAIIEAAGQGHAEVVRLLLADPRVDPCDQDKEALTAAAQGRHFDVVGLLLDDVRVNPPD